MQEIFKKRRLNEPSGTCFIDNTYFYCIHNAIQCVFNFE